ncbi:MAG: hypothetical protein JNL42_04800 [Anaerolineae bacterium]|nr:hypothetical protein [Anaerolineae bacterium]
MNNSGSSDTPSEQAVTSETGGGETQRRPSLLLIFLVVAAVSLALYFGVNVLGVLFAMIAPPKPPVPAGLTEIGHESEAYGVDLWTYTSLSDPCEYVAQFEQFGVCSVAPLQCGEIRTTPDLQLEASQVARCAGEQEFSIFTMQWWARIARVNADGSTRLELEREVFWIGEGEQQVGNR